MRIPWYQKPILKNNQYIDIQKNAMMIGLFAIVSREWYQDSSIQLTPPSCILSFQFLALFTIGTAIFDIYCLAMAAPGSTHYGYYIISYEFVYVGNKHGKYEDYNASANAIREFQLISSVFSTKHVDGVCFVFLSVGHYHILYKHTVGNST